MRFAWVAVVSGLLLSACGGGPGSPDFDGDVVGLEVTPEQTSLQQVGQTVQLMVQGLYSTPPGTAAGVPCAASTGFCVRGPAPSNIVWTVDGNNPNASVDARGVVTGIRNGSAVVRATFREISDVSTVFIGAINYRIVPATASVEPDNSVQFTAEGLYLADAGATGTEDCSGSATDADTRVCSVGPAPAGLSWSVDPVSSGTAIASINSSSGLASGLRRGLATVRARVTNLPEKTATLTVNGPVLSSVTISAVDAKNNVAATTVPTGRSFVLTGVATCESGFPGGTGANAPNPSATCTNQDYQYSWSLPSTTDPATVEFTPTSATGESIAVKTKRFGSFQIIARYLNEEGLQKEATVSLNASERVLDDILVSADPVQAAPVPVIIGTKTRFIAKGVFSDGNTDDIRAGDLKTALVWTQDASAVGKVTIEQSATSPNAAVLVSGDTVGITGLTATSSNTETGIPGKPNGLELADRIGVEVKTFGLLGLVDICPFDSVGSECLQSPQLPLGTTTKFKVRGSFQDSPNVPRDIDPSKIGLTWSKTVTPSSGDVTVVSAGTPAVTTGEFTATKLGAVTLNVVIANPLVEQAAAPRQVSSGVTVIESLCRDQLLASNGTTSAVSSSNVTNAGNAIDSDANSFATMTLTPGFIIAGDDETVSYQRSGTVVVPPGAGLSVGFLVSYDPTLFPADTNATIQTLNAAGAVVQDFAVSASQLTAQPTRNGQTLAALKINVTMPFTGLRLTLTPPDAESPAPPTNTPLDALLALLGGGGETDVNVYGTCANLP